MKTKINNIMTVSDLLNNDSHEEKKVIYVLSDEAGATEIVLNNDEEAGFLTKSEACSAMRKIAQKSFIEAIKQSLIENYHTLTLSVEERVYCKHWAGKYDLCRSAVVATAMCKSSQDFEFQEAA